MKPLFASEALSPPLVGVARPPRPSWRLTTLVLLALVWTQLPLGGGARAEGRRGIELCCAWGRAMEDAELTWSLRGGDPATAEALRSAVNEWDSALSLLTLTEVGSRERVDIALAFNESGGPTEGQAVTSFTRRGLIRQVEVTVNGPRAPDGVSALVQIAKHELGHALGLGHADHDGNLMSEEVSPAPSAIPGCAIQGVVEANRWKMVDGAERPQRPTAAEVTC